MKLLSSKTLVVLTFLSAFLGCKKNGDTFDKGNGDAQKKVTSADYPQGASAVLGNTKPALSSEYDVFVKTRSGTTLCKGHTKININSNFTMSFVDSTLKCLTVNVDLNKLLASTNAGSGGVLSNDGKSQVSSDGKVLRVSSIGPATFNPPRPLILGPVIQDPKIYQGFFEEKQYSVKTTNPAGAGNGSIRVQVLGIDESFQPEGYKGQLKFDKILRWKMEATGFEGITKSSALLFDSMEFYWSTNPIAIPRILIESDLDELMKGSVVGGDVGPLGNIGGAIIGKLTIELSLTSHESL